MSRIEAVYRIRAPRAEIERVAHAIALEQSVEVPAEAVRDAYVAAEVVASVGAVTQRAPDLFDVHIGLAEVTTGGDVAQTVNMLFGNSSLHPHVELVDAIFPDALAARFGGPRHGVAGLRALLGVSDRPLTCAALKPQGLASGQLAELCATFARGGIASSRTTTGSPISPTRRSRSAPACASARSNAPGATLAGALSTRPALSGPRRPWSSARRSFGRRGSGSYCSPPP